MDEFTVLALVAEGENERVDFKRELNLGSSDDKAEFIKDVIALANSASNVGYLIIGIDNSKRYVGIEKLEEEQIQQLAYTYIEPTVKLRCELVPIANPVPLIVGLIKVYRSIRPHKVARAVGRLSQNEVFVRRGSITSKATPEEIIEMRRIDRKRGEAETFIAVAETHLKAGNYADAIVAYSRAIKDMPSYELFLARAEAHIYALEQWKKSLGGRSELFLPPDEQRQYWKTLNSLSRAVLEDFMSAIRLAKSSEAELLARLKRFRFGCLEVSSNYTWQDKEDEFQWLRKNLSGRDLGEVIWLYVETWELLGTGWKVGEEAISLMDEAIELGYTEPRAFYLRARGHILAGNYGMVIRDIDAALATIDQKDTDEVVNMLCDRAKALTELERFDEAHKTLFQAREIDPESVRSHLMLSYGLEEKILHQCSLEYEFNPEAMDASMLHVARFLTLWKGRTNFRNAKGRQVSDLNILEEACPGILNYLKEIVGKEYWIAMHNERNLDYQFSFPNLHD